MPEQVTLRPVREDDLPLLRTLAQGPQVTGEFEQYGWYAPRLFQRGWEDNGLISADGGTLVVACGEEVLGAVSWPRRHTAPASHRWVLGIALFPRARGRGHGTQAHRLLVGHLFAHTTPSTGSRPRPRPATSPSKKPWSEPGSAAKASCAAPAGAAARGATRSSTA